MKRFTFITGYQGLNSVTQYCTDTLNAAMHQWADGPLIDGIGPKGRAQLHQDIDNPLWQPLPYLEMPNVWETVFWINQRELQCHVVATVMEVDPDCPINTEKYEDGYYTIETLHTIMKKVNRYKDECNWTAMKRCVQRPIAQYPMEYILLLNLAEACFMLDEHEECLDAAERAVRLNAKDPLCTFYHALALFDNQRFEETIAECDKIIDMDFRYLAHGQYGDGLDEAHHYLYDCMAMKGLSLLHIGKAKEGRPLVETYLKKADASLSHYKKSYIRKCLAELTPSQS